MSPEQTLFHIPVYYRTQDAHERACAEDEHRLLEEQRLSFAKQGSKPSEAQVERIRYQYERYQWLPWVYNDVLAWFRVYAIPVQIRADCYLHDAKRFDRRSLKRFKCESAGGITVPVTHRSQTEVVEMLKSDLRKYTRKYLGKRRYVDLSPIDNLLPLVCWKKLFPIVGHER